MEENQQQAFDAGETANSGQANSQPLPGKDIAIISYITIVGLIIAFVMNNDKKHPFAYYHIRQVVGLVLTGAAIWVIGIIPILGWLIAIIGSILMLIMWISGLINAINGKMQPMPILGKQYAKWFEGIGK